MRVEGLKEKDSTFDEFQFISKANLIIKNI